MAHAGRRGLGEPRIGVERAAMEKSFHLHEDPPIDSPAQTRAGHSFSLRSPHVWLVIGMLLFCAITQYGYLLPGQ
ncbi:MAG: hypothetical protein M1531_11825, partial [Chloroflexi bacterium]|nr:hypothetical protein [Chloroflexota bacterium]